MLLLNTLKKVKYSILKKKIRAYFLIFVSNCNHFWDMAHLKKTFKNTKMAIYQLFLLQCVWKKILKLNMSMIIIFHFLVFVIWQLFNFVVFSDQANLDIFDDPSKYKSAQITMTRKWKIIDIPMFNFRIFFINPFKQKQLLYCHFCLSDGLLLKHHISNTMLQFQTLIKGKI